MLITFTCDAHETIVMFGDIAQKLLGMMGYQGKTTGSLEADDIPVVRTRLRNALDTSKKEQSERNIEPDNNKNTDTKEPQVSLEHRAFPLFEMLDAAEKEKCAVQWKSS